MATAHKLITSRACAPLAEKMADVCRAGLDGSAIRVWHDLHASQRLAMALMAAHEARYTWTLEAAKGRAAVYGVSGNCMKHVFIAVKLINVVTDLTLGRQEPQLAVPPHDDTDVWELAEWLATLDEKKMLALPLNNGAADVKSVAPRTTAGNIVDDAKAQAGEYAASWLKEHELACGDVLDTYVAVAIGPLRWHIQRVDRHTVAASDRRCHCLSAKLKYKNRIPTIHHHRGPRHH